MQHKRGTDSNQNSRRHFTVVYACTQDYWEHTFVSLYSLVKNNRSVPLDIQVLADAPDNRFFSNAAKLKRMHSDVEVSWLPIDSAELRGVETGEFSRACLYRMLLGRLLSDEIERVLYVDSDTVVHGSLSSLLELELGSKVLAAAPQHNLRPPPLDPYDYAGRLELPSGTSYFNSGVLLINLSRWRELGIEERCLQYVRENLDKPQRLEFPDQDALNSVLVGQWVKLDPAFNFSDWTVEPDTFLGGSKGCSVHPVVVHFAGRRKPWHGGTRHPYEGLYWHYRRQTPYADSIKMVRSKAVGAVIRLARYVSNQSWATTIRKPRLKTGETD